MGIARIAGMSNTRSWLACSSVILAASCHATEWGPAPRITREAPANAVAPPAASRGPPPSFTEGVRVHLEKLDAQATTISFGLPLGAGRVQDASRLSVRVDGR